MPVEAPTLTGKRVNFVLSEKAYNDLTDLSKQHHRSMTEIVRLGLGMAKLALEASNRGDHVVITSSSGDPIKEIVVT